MSPKMSAQDDWPLELEGLHTLKCRWPVQSLFCKHAILVNFILFFQDSDDETSQMLAAFVDSYPDTDEPELG